VKVYTKAGDRGRTSLYSGGRVAKDHPRIEAYGTVDELNSVLGLLLAEDLPDGDLRRLRDVQTALFDIGASLADPEHRLTETGGWTTGHLEDWIDAMDAELPELRAFILPGGCREAALAHVARTVCRRAERRVLAIDDVAAGIVPFLNRLSDVLFMYARYLNARRGISDPEWRPER
jgi:cob(I)alamin adenosyltransferase